MSKTIKCISSDSLLSALRKKLKDDSITIKKLSTSQPNLDGSHFTSVVEELEVTYVTIEKIEKTIHLFAKYQPENKNHKQILDNMNFCLKEIRFYDTLIPAMEEFCEKESATGISLLYPKCFYTKYDGVKNVVVLENLRKLGFRLNPFTIERQDFHHSKLVMEALANFHAITFAMIRKTGYPNLKQCPFLEEMVYGEAGKKAFGESLEKGFDHVLKSLEGDSQHHDLMTKLRRVRNKMFDISSALLKDPEPFQVVCHGDCWNNNIVFRYDRDGTPVEVILLDMQVIRISSLTIDLIYYFMTSTTAKFRKENLTELLRYYYETFTSSLGFLGIRDCGFSLQEMLEDYRRRYAFNIAFMPQDICFPLLPETDIKDVREDDNVIEDINNLIAKVVANPITGKIFKDEFIAVYEELKYSLENAGVEY